MSRGLPNGWSNATRHFRRYASIPTFPRGLSLRAVNSALREGTSEEHGVQDP